MQTAKDMMLCGAVLCALCGGRLKYHGCYSRGVLDEDGDRENGWIVQCRCDACRVYPALIPSFVMPYKQYKASVIESVIAATESGVLVERIDGCAADFSTMRYWVRQFRERGAQAVGQLLSILLTLYDRHVSLLKLQRKGLLKQLARLLREYPVLENGGIIGRVNVVLTTQNCGFL